jgi:hypothetical protein
MVDGKPVFLKDLFPKFADQELSRAIRIPLQDPISPELEETLQLIAEHPDVYLNTGHVSGAEAMRLVELAERFGIQKILVAHPARRRLTMDEMQEIASRGVFLEAVFAECAYPGGVPRTHYYAEREYMHDIPGDPSKSYGLRELGQEIRAIGMESYVLATDYGVRAAAPPVEGMRQFIASLLDMEFTPDEIRAMTSINPARLLGLE